MDIVARAQGILFKPKEEWVKIKPEPTSIRELFTSYAVILAAIPVVAQFLGWALVGFRIPFAGGSWMGRAILYLIFSYIFGLVAVYVFGVIINALAPNFSSTQNLPNAMKLAVYSMTPGWLAGIFYIIPSIAFLAVLGFLYGIYVLYLGFATPLMETPKEKVVVYLVVSVVVMIVLWAVIGLILGGIFAVRGLVGFF